jgi:hypothetical protein
MVLALVIAAGCKHLSSEQKAVLKQAQLIMKERALAVDAFKGFTYPFAVPCSCSSPCPQQ